jgi:hypothetical protein
MKRFTMLLVALAVVIAPVYAGAQQSGGKEAPPAIQPQSSDVKAEPRGAAKSYTPGERKAYEKKVAADLDEIQQNIADLRLQSRKGAPQKKDMMLMAAKNLQFQTIAAKNRLAQLEKTSGDAWSGAKADLDKAMADLRQAWEEAAVLMH